MSCIGRIAQNADIIEFSLYENNLRINWTHLVSLFIHVLIEISEKLFNWQLTTNMTKCTELVRSPSTTLYTMQIRVILPRWQV